MRSGLISIPCGNKCGCQIIVILYFLTFSEAETSETETEVYLLHTHDFFYLAWDSKFVTEHTSQKIAAFQYL